MPRGPTGWLLRLDLRLRDRVVLGFGLLALGLSVLLAVVTWTLVSGYLLDQRESTALVETQDNATAVQRGLLHAAARIPALLDGLPASDQSASLLVFGGEWYATSLTQGPDRLPDALVRETTSGTTVTQRLNLDGHVVLAVGVPMSEPGNAYFELFPLVELDRTFRVLSVVLLGAATATSLLGLVVGRFASDRALRPLADVAGAAAAIAQGDLDARIHREHDPDLGSLARSFNRTAEALQRRVRADARFAGDVSHELRTPLTTMLNSLELVQNRRAELPSSVREPLDLLSVEMERFRRMVVDLLEISRDEEPGGREVEQVAIADLVRRAADAAAGRPITRVSREVGAVSMLVDKRRLERVFTNLVENAEVHGGGCTAVTVGCHEGHVRVQVDDSGPGVPLERRERIFERFARNEPGAGPGVGLGLAIVARQVSWHRGRVWVEGHPSGGARFVVELPMEGADDGSL